MFALGAVIGAWLCRRCAAEIDGCKRTELNGAGIRFRWGEGPVALVGVLGVLQMSSDFVSRDVETRSRQPAFLLL